ncbi:MAG: serine/threonine protein kinase, partial [Planctomycetes bacterium]|nr:serine/threonine protein kinase [Planctomycetota bacterium]
MRAAETYLGSTIAGRFLIERVLGAGGMGVVFLALDQSSQRRVALKLAMAASDPTRIARFVREGEVSASLDHPGIVRIYSAGAVEGQPYLVYELIEGARELQDVFPQLNLPGRVALVQQVVQALGYAHSRGVVHRDVKPENVLVDHEGRARLADFGIASVAGADRLTATGAWVGTPQYMAPERFQSGAATPASDVWSAGVLLYEALTSTPPFPGKTLQELAPQIALARPTPPSRIVDHVPRRLERVCLRALSADLALRYKDGRAFAEDIERALKDEPLSARPRSKAFLGLAGLLGVGFFGVAVAYALKTTVPEIVPVMTSLNFPFPSQNFYKEVGS